MIYCHICYTMDVEPQNICDICGGNYCEKCSYLFTVHYQHQGSRCFECAGQRRLDGKPTTQTIRENKIKLIEYEINT